MIPLQLKNNQHISQKEVDLQHHQQPNKVFNSESFEINYFFIENSKGIFEIWRTSKHFYYFLYGVLTKEVWNAEDNTHVQTIITSKEERSVLVSRLYHRNVK